MRVLGAQIAATFLGSALPVRAQEGKEPSGPAAYKVEFDIRNGGDGETQPNQHFSMLIDESRKGVPPRRHRNDQHHGSCKLIGHIPAPHRTEENGV